jgi:hypothetical protein
MVQDIKGWRKERKREIVKDREEARGEKEK